MTVTRIWYHRFRKPKDVGSMPTTPDGNRDLLDVFEAYARSCIGTSNLVRTTRETYSEVVQVDRHGRAVTVKFLAGRFGEEGSIRDVSSRAQVGTFTSKQATTVTTHGVLIVPENGTSALAFNEWSAAQSGMATLIDNFNEHFDGLYTDFRMKRDAVVQSDAWLKHAELTKVSAKIRNYSTDIAGTGSDEVIGTLRHEVVPEPGLKYFPRKVWTGLLTRKISRSKFLGFEEGAALDEIEVTASDGTQSKTFEISDERTPAFRRVLTGSGETAWADDRFREEALKEAPEMFRHYGVEWTTNPS